MASPASGTIRRNAFCPMVVPSCPMIVPSGVSNRSNPSPHDVPMRPRSGRSTSRPCILAAVPGASTWVPSAARPSSRCMRANATRSRGRIASIEPAGAFDRAMAQIGAGTYAPPCSSWM